MDWMDWTRWIRSADGYSANPKSRIADRNRVDPSRQKSLHFFEVCDQASGDNAEMGMDLAEAGEHTWSGDRGEDFNRIWSKLTDGSEACFDCSRIECEGALDGDQPLFARSSKYLSVSRDNTGGATRSQIFSIDRVPGKSGQQIQIYERQFALLSYLL